MATILVIDDERMVCDLLRAVLSRHGHEVLTSIRALDSKAAVIVLTGAGNAAGAGPLSSDPAVRWGPENF
jgi:CheY-like chemotaxis protein